MKWRNQLLALSCLLVFLGFGVFYFRYWVVQKPFGIILFVGEGLGPGRLAVTRIYAGGADKPLNIDSLPYTALLRNYSRDSAIPDQAAAATALSTGVKVNNGSVGIDSEGKALRNLIELARESGRMTGLVTDASLTNATVASFYAHTASKEDRQNLARELIEGGNVDLILGGGAEEFLPANKGGHRADERDLLAEMQDAGYDVVRTRAELDDIPRWRQAKLLGIFSPSNLAFASTDADESDRPSLADMVRRGIELLQFNSGGYLLVVDAGLMGRAAEQDDTLHTLTQTLELDRAVAVAREYAGTKSTIFVTGDVASGGFALAGYPPLSVTGAAFLEPGGSTRASWLAVDVPESRLGPSAGPAAEGNSQDAGSAESPTPRDSSFSRRADDIIAFGVGLGADSLHGTIDNTTIFEIIRENL